MSAHLFDIVPVEIQNPKYRGQLTSAGREAFRGLCHFANKKGMAWPAIATLAEYLGCSNSTVARGIVELKKLDLIERVKVAFRRTATYFIPSYLQARQAAAGVSSVTSEDRSSEIPRSQQRQTEQSQNKPKNNSPLPPNEPTSVASAGEGDLASPDEAHEAYEATVAKTKLDAKADDADRERAKKTIAKAIRRRGMRQTRQILEAATRDEFWSGEAPRYTRPPTVHLMVSVLHDDKNAAALLERERIRQRQEHVAEQRREAQRRAHDEGLAQKMKDLASGAADGFASMMATVRLGLDGEAAMS